MKIVVCSDNHKNKKVLEDIANLNYDADYYFHLGDSELHQEEIRPFISVKGNTDRGCDFPLMRVIEIKNHRFLLLHSNNELLDDFKNLVSLAKDNDCDVVLFGHAHRFYDLMLDNVRLINPGSCAYNRDGSNPSYVILNLDNNDKINLERKFI